MFTQEQVDKLLEQKPKPNIHIIRKGFANIPDEAMRCPVCRKYQSSYHLESTNDSSKEYPTFTCWKCQTIWQYLGEEKD